MGIEKCYTSQLNQLRVVSGCSAAHSRDAVGSARGPTPRETRTMPTPALSAARRPLPGRNPVPSLIPIPIAGHSPGLPACPAAGSEEGRPRRFRDGGGGGGGGRRRRGEARGSDPAGGTGTSPKLSSSSRVQAAGMALGVDGRGGGGGRGVVVHIPGAGQ